MLMNRLSNFISSFTGSKSKIDAIWTHRPSLPTAPLRIHPEKYAGKTAAEKIEDLKKAMTEKDLDGMFVSMLDEVCCRTLFFTAATIYPLTSSIRVPQGGLAAEH